MARYGVVQLDLQRVLGLSQTAVSKRLRGLTPWDINELAAVAEFFRMPLGELIAAADRPHPSGPEALDHGSAHRLKSRNGITAQYGLLPVDLTARRLKRSGSRVTRNGYPQLPDNLGAERLRHAAKLSTRRGFPSYLELLPRRAA